MGSKIFKNMEILKKEFEEQKLIKEKSTTPIYSESKNKENFLTISQLDFSEIDNWELDNKELEFCKDKIKRIISHTANSYLFLGKEFEEIFQKFAVSGSKEGIYEKLVTFLGFNYRTALRCRKRYKIFDLAKTNISKEIIATLPMIMIEKLSKLSNDEITKLLDNSNSKEEVEMGLNIEQIEFKEKKASDKLSGGWSFSEDKILDIFDNFPQKLEKLPTEKKEKVNKMIANIEKIFNENSDK